MDIEKQDEVHTKSTFPGPRCLFADGDCDLSMFDDNSIRPSEAIRSTQSVVCRMTHTSKRGP